MGHRSYSSQERAIRNYHVKWLAAAGGSRQHRIVLSFEQQNPGKGCMTR